MKKVLALLAIAGFVACNNADDATKTADTAAKAPEVTAPAADTSAKKDTMAPVSTDTTKKK